MKSKIVPIRFNQFDFECIKEIADKKNMTVSLFIRHSVNQVPEMSAKRLEKMKKVMKEFNLSKQKSL